MQRLTNGHILTIDLTANTAIAHARVYVISKIEDGRTLGKLKQVAFRRENIHLVFVKIHLKLVHQLQVIVAFEGRPNVSQPFIDVSFALDSFVTPVRGKAMFGHFIHPFGSDLHLHPLVVGS